MTVIHPLRALFLCLAVPAMVLAAGIGSANNGPVPSTVAVSGKGYWPASAGRLCPQEVGYGRYGQPITVQDI